SATARDPDHRDGRHELRPGPHRRDHSGERRRDPCREAHLPEKGGRDPRGPSAIRRRPQGSDARGHGLRTVDDGRAIRRWHRCPAREEDSAGIRARRGRGLPARRPALRGAGRGRFRGGDCGQERGRVMASSKDHVKRLREETGAGVMDCKRALDEAKGDFEKAKTLIKERGLAKAKEKADRDAREGVVEAYVHAGGRIGAMVELSSETDFVARNPDFKELAREIAMQVAAMDPTDVDQLLEQPYIRDASKTIGELVTTIAASTGENVRVKRFKRFELGQSNGEPT